MASCKGTLTYSLSLSLFFNVNPVEWVQFLCICFQIPFSKFFLAAKGHVQDKQCFLPDMKVGRIGITSAGMDHMDGEFSLELDYIGLEMNYDYREEFAYELYQMPKYVVGQ